MDAFRQGPPDHLEPLSAVVCVSYRDLQRRFELLSCFIGSTSSAKNTIHVDDLVRTVPRFVPSFAQSQHQSRNFALNPGQGLKIRPFKNAHTSEALADRELDKLSRYLVHIAGVDDFQRLKHRVRECVASCLSLHLLIC
jgi:hypothetical protein